MSLSLRSCSTIVHLHVLVSPLMCNNCTPPCPCLSAHVQQLYTSMSLSLRSCATTVGYIAMLPVVSAFTSNNCRLHPRVSLRSYPQLQATLPCCPLSLRLHPTTVGYIHMCRFVHIRLHPHVFVSSFNSGTVYIGCIHRRVLVSSFIFHNYRLHQHVFVSSFTSNNCRLHQHVFASSFISHNCTIYCHVFVSSLTFNISQ